MADGDVTLDADKIEARQDALLRKLIENDAFVLVILGGAHDLSDNVARLSDGACDYVRVTTRSVRCFAPRESK